MGGTYSDTGRLRRVGWLSDAIEQGFTVDEQRVLEHALALLARLADV